MPLTSVFQSGKFKSSNNKISKRGSSYLRKSLYQATVAGISKRSKGILNPVLYEYYSKKLAEGKPSNVAIVATSSKLLIIIFGVPTNQQQFAMRLIPLYICFSLLYGRPALLLSFTLLEIYFSKPLD